MLDDAQQALLIDLVEADRRVPREQRQAFLAFQVSTSAYPRAHILHPGWHDKERLVPAVDIETLASGGLIQARHPARHQTSFFVTPAGSQRYAEIKRTQGQPIE